MGLLSKVRESILTLKGNRASWYLNVVFEECDNMPIEDLIHCNVLCVCVCVCV